MTSALPLPFLFDLDGTLVDSLPDIAASANFTRVHYDLPEASLDDVRSMVGDGLITLLRKALAPLPNVESCFEDAEEIYRNHYFDQCVRLTRPYDGVTECLRSWHDAGHPLAVVTNKPEQFAHRILAHLDLARWLPVVVGGDSIAARKPDPSPVWTALDRLGVSRERGLMVGDSVGDILAGRRAGIRTAAAVYGYQPEVDLRAAGADEFWMTFGAGHRRQGA